MATQTYAFLFELRKLPAANDTNASGEFTLFQHAWAPPCPDTLTAPINTPAQINISLPIPLQKITMSPTVKRNSSLNLQNLLMPSLFHHLHSEDTAPTQPANPDAPMKRNHGSESSSPPKALSRHSPPPDYLLNEDPFANLGAGVGTMIHSTSPFPSTSTATLPPPTSPTTSKAPTPRSPLAQSPSHGPKSNVIPSPPVVLRKSSTGHITPAFQKPAFTPRPSLPTLQTLSESNVIITHRVRRGRVGAQLPLEPWDSDSERVNEVKPRTSTSLFRSDSLSNCRRVEDGHESDDDYGELMSTEPLFLDSVHHSATRDMGAAGEIVPESTLFWDTLGSPLDVASVLSSVLPAPSSTSSSSSPMSEPCSSVDDHSLGGDQQFYRHSHDCSSSSHSDVISVSHSISSLESESDGLYSPPDESPYTHPLIELPDEELARDSNSYTKGSSPPSSFAPLAAEPNIWSEHEASTGTIRGAANPWHAPAEHNTPLGGMWNRKEEPRDSSGWEGDRYISGGSAGPMRGSRGRNVGDSHGGGHGRAGGGDGRRHGSGSGDGRDDRDWNNRPQQQSSFTESSEETSEDEDSADDYGEPAKPVAKKPTSADSSDDDIPLAKRIPTALKAQRTIRIKAKEEREQRRAARAARRGQPPPVSAHAIMTGSQEATLHTTNQPRKRTQTLPPEPLHADIDMNHLHMKLQGFSLHDAPAQRPARHPTLRSRPASPSRGGATLGRSATTASRPSSPRGGRPSFDPEVPVPMIPSSPRLRQMRSFHHPDGRRAFEPPVSAPVETERLGRSNTRGRKSREEPPAARARSVSRPRAITNPEAPPEMPALPRVSGELERAKLVKNRPRPSLDAPALPVPSAIPLDRNVVSQQRIFIGDLQSFNMVEIGLSTNAGDVIQMVEAQGSLKAWVGSGDWMLWEVAQDFGLERPIRNFELISDVEASWNKDKMVNTFVLKLTPLAPILKISGIPSASPMCSGYVECEIKRGKWSKRWLTLREHNLYLAKRDNGKDEVFLCAMSNFDFYTVTRVHKAPKAFTFAIKSTDNLAIFENTDDYMHMFSCNERDGAKWMERILLARSYVLYQERNVLFTGRTSNAAAPSAGLTRAGTRKVPKSQATLLNLAGPDVFASGSLLSKAT